MAKNTGKVSSEKWQPWVTHNFVLLWLRQAYSLKAKSNIVTAVLSQNISEFCGSHEI